MNPLYTTTDFEIAKSTQPLPLSCIQCNNTFFTIKKEIKRRLKSNKRGNCFCSHECANNSAKAQIKTKCTTCDKYISKVESEYNKSVNHFCSNSCAATYNNTNKTHGTRRSKLEIWLETKLTLLYPNLSILYCDKTKIKSELDIYITSLDLAFELNGIYHYEPIHGQDKLNKIQNNDNRKFQACLENNIELVIIDSSTLKYFKEQNCIKYLDIISNIINIKLNLANLL